MSKIEKTKSKTAFTPEISFKTKDLVSQENAPSCIVPTGALTGSAFGQTPAWCKKMATGKNCCMLSTLHRIHTGNKCFPVIALPWYLKVWIKTVIFLACWKIFLNRVAGM
jgi:hypothetical protein